MRIQFFNDAGPNSIDKWPESLRAIVYPRDSNEHLSVKVSFRANEAWVFWPATWAYLHEAEEFGRAVIIASKIAANIKKNNGFFIGEFDTETLECDC